MWNYINILNVYISFTGNRGVFGTQSNIYGGVFLHKNLAAKS